VEVLLMKIRSFILEDDLDIQGLLTDFLEGRGYEVMVGEEPGCCPLYFEEKCTCPRDAACGDILFADINLPKMTGLDFIRNQHARGCKGIVKNKSVMTASCRQEDIDEAARLGCKIFHKPFKLSEVASWLDECEARIDSNRKLVPISELGM